MRAKHPLCVCEPVVEADCELDAERTYCSSGTVTLHLGAKDRMQIMGKRCGATLDIVYKSTLCMRVVAPPEASRCYSWHFNEEIGSLIEDQGSVVILELF
ncbi:unnamed protein product [Citrullus colocynthis]|uniref:Uncharacterized protein n=1 Tax=Citrullus colocynthis TaxID=252529 RepID=A0ABP0Z4S1_9ROSI